MVGLSKKTAYQAGAAVPLLLGLLTLSGCTEGYPEDLKYPLRSDPIVDTRAIESSPTQLDPPGTLEQWIESLPAKGGKLLDPRAAVEKHQLAKVNEHLSKGHFDLSDDDRNEIGLKTRPEGKDAAKAALEERRDALQKQIADIEKTMSQVSGDLDKTLNDLFGTPAKPKVEGADGPHMDEATLANGSVLYRRHCLHCHGLTGDGRGPTAPWVNPHPRDYRKGKFKFTSTSQGEGSRKARREDLLRTLRQGIDGTSMPSFGLLSDDELQALVSYVIHLSVRGQVEESVLSDALGSKEGVDDIDGTAKKKLKGIWRAWKSAQDDANAIVVGAAPSYAGKPAGELSKAEREEWDKSVARGFEIFTTGKGKCRQCHNDFGRANDYKYDEWGTIVRPANLTAGTYRGGRRPLDLYYRISAGINGSKMPAHDTALKPEEIWDIVNFLEAMPYRNMLPPEVKEQVYGKE
jgi:mono/diheme cytochrome c family protein